MANRFTQRKIEEKKSIYSDYTLICVVLFLVAFGLIMLYSTSSYMAKLQKGNSAYFFIRQLAFSCVGLLAMVILSRIPHRHFEKFAVLAYIVSVVLLLLVIPFGKEVNGAKRWLPLVGDFSFQPVEVIKAGLILFLASLICKMGNGIRTLKGVAIVLGSSALLAGMVGIITNNMSSAIILMGIAVVMLFVATPYYKPYIFSAIAIIVLALGYILYVVNAAKAAVTVDMDFRGRRILAWLDLEAFADKEGFQVLHALYAIGSGGLWGKGLGQSMQKLGFLPEASNDMIFSIICEELGLIGGLTVMLLFMILIWRLMRIIVNVNDLFGALLVTGILAHIAIQVILNVAVVTNSMPNTGISLPFISYGGTAIMCTLAEMGVALSVGRSIKVKD